MNILPNAKNSRENVIIKSTISFIDKENHFMKLIRTRLLIFLVIFCSMGLIQAATTLSAGDVIILAINGDTDASNNYGRGFSFMPLVNLEAGTIINFTDYGWSDLTTAFITNTSVADAFIHYTVPAGGITAGTVIRCDSYSNTNFTFDFSYSGSGNNYLNTAGLTQGDELLIFQGSRSTPTFIFAASIVSTAIVASGWATNVGTNGTDGSGAGSALPPGLSDDATALSFNRDASANDNCAYSGTTTAETRANWQNRIKNYSNWTFNDAAPIPTPLTGPYTVTDASLPVTLSSFIAGIQGNTIVLNWQTASETDNLGFTLERAAGNSGWQPIASYRTHPALKGQGNTSTTTTYSFTDNTVTTGTEYRYRLGDVNVAGVVTMHSPITVITTALPQTTEMFNAYPNPFNPETTINYKLHKDSQVTIIVYDLLGRKVKTLIDEQQSAGSYQALWNGTDEGGAKAASGAYLVRMQTAEVTQTQKVLLVK